MSGVVNEIPRWEKELRAWAGPVCDKHDVWLRIHSIKYLISRGLLRPVEDEPAEPNDEQQDRGEPSECPSYERGSPSIALGLRPPEDWTPFDGAKPAFTEEDADHLLARLDAAEAEIARLKMENAAKTDQLSEAWKENLARRKEIADLNEAIADRRIEIQRLHGRLDGVARTIAQGLASASDVVMNEVGK